MTDSRKYAAKLQDANTLVIGGTSGIGFCIAEQLLEAGAHVVIASSRQSSLDNALSRLQDSYPVASKTHLRSHAVDMKSESSIAELLKFTTNDGQNLLDHIADTSGDTLPLKPLEELDEDYIVSSQRVRWNGTLFLAKHAKPLLKRTSRSSLTLTGGVNSYLPFGKQWYLPSGVGAGKDGLARGLAVNMAPVRVNLVAPGAVLTELFKRTFEDPEQLKKLTDQMGGETLVGQIGKPEDVSEAYIYCMKDAFITGTVITSEGGVLIGKGKDQ